MDVVTAQETAQEVLEIVKDHKLTVCPLDLEQDEGWVAMLATWRGSSHEVQASTLEGAVFAWVKKYGQKGASHATDAP